MNRLGVAPEQAGALQRTLAAMPCVGKVSLMTHFADADRPGGAQAAMERFERATADLPGSRSLANSAAIFDVPQAHRDWIRPGIALYGASPFADRGAAALGLRAAMTLRSELVAVQALQAGDAVGYGSTFVADGPMRIGIVACGYADGYPRHAPTGTPVEVAGIRTRTLGRVSMDLLAVDLAPVPEAAVGASVELWGERVPVDEVAASAGTVGYELLCAVAPRVPMHRAD
jgi:alanine racemase